MADKATDAILAGLSLALTEPLGAPLHKNKSSVGLFPTNALGKQAALRCKEAGWLRVVREETKGKTTIEVCQITEQGLAQLLRELSPKQVLEDLVRSLDARQRETHQVLAATQEIQTSLSAIKQLAEQVLSQVQKPSTPPPTSKPTETNGTVCWQQAVLAYLQQRRYRTTAGDCPLPELYQQACQHASSLTIGQFHDELRKMVEQEKLYLHPWTGPLYDLPEPSFALLIGHEIAYYANLR